MTGFGGMRRWLAVVAAWAPGAGVYVAAAVAWNGYDGFPDLLLLPACGAVVSATVVAFCLLAGLVVRPTPLGRAWRSGRVWAAAVAVGSAGLLGFGSALGLTAEYTHPDTGERFRGLHPAAALGGYFLLLAAVALWPFGRR